MRLPEVRLASVTRRKFPVVAPPMALIAPVPSGARLILPLVAVAVRRERACPLMAKVPEVDSMVGELEPRIMSPSLFIMGMVFSTAEAEAGYPWGGSGLGG